jgi:hypothetical protein
MIKEQSAEASHHHTKRIKTTTRTSDSDSESVDQRGSSASFDGIPTGNERTHQSGHQPIPESFWAQTDVKGKSAVPQMTGPTDESGWIDPSQFPQTIKLLNIYYLLFRELKRQSMA